MVVGKLYILTAISVASADALEPPRFFEYTNGSALTRAVNVSFGWFNKLDKEQAGAYEQSIVHAMEFAELGQRVTWYKNGASGYAVAVAGWPSTSGSCKRLHVQATAFNVVKGKELTACFDNTTSKWTIHADK